MVVLKCELLGVDDHAYSRLCHIMAYKMKALDVSKMDEVLFLRLLFSKSATLMTQVKHRLRR